MNNKDILNALNMENEKKAMDKEEQVELPSLMDEETR